MLEEFFHLYKAGYKGCIEAQTCRASCRNYISTRDRKKKNKGEKEETKKKKRLRVLSLHLCFFLVVLKLNVNFINLLKMLR